MKDVIVVGAGVAGCIAARFAAKNGASVLLIDRKGEREIGRKVCGDAVASCWFEQLGIERPRDVRKRIRKFRIYSPSKKVIECRTDEGYILDRYGFGQQLLDAAVNAGAELMDKCTVTGPIVEGGKICGVRARNGEFRAGVTIDASGVVGILRRNSPLPETKVAPEDLQICYREIRESKVDLDECVIFFNQELFPGGYAWIFPKDGEMNVGVGNQLSRRTDPEESFRKLLSEPLLGGSRMVERGRWIVPTRRALDSMVCDGLIVIGDAACTTNPSTGGGIGPSMLSGRIAGEVASLGNPSLESLWRFNVRYMREFGALQASLDVFRRFLQRLNNRQIEIGMKIARDVVGIGDVGRISVDWIKAIFHPVFLMKAMNVKRRMKYAHQIYGSFPSPDGFHEWFGKVKMFWART